MNGHLPASPSSLRALDIIVILSPAVNGLSSVWLI